MTALLVVSLIVYGSLFPWHFDAAHSPSNPLVGLLHSWPTQWSRLVIRDAFANVLVYIPVGLTLFLALRRTCRAAMAFTTAVLSAVFLSANMEMLQLYIPGRACSLLDLITNTAGGLAGAILGLVYHRKFPPSADEHATHPHRRHIDAILLLAFWGGYQLYPLFPLLNPERLRHGVAYLLHSGIYPLEVWANAAEWFAAGLAIEAVDLELPSIWLAVPMLCMLLRILIAGRLLTLDEVAGGALALFLLVGMSRQRRPRAGIWLLGSAILLRELAPFHFTANAAKFSWIPFRTSLDAEHQAAVVLFMRKAFDYGAVAWLLRRRGISYLYAAAGLGLTLFGCEWAQRYMPYHAPEITDSVIAVLMAVTFHLVERQGTVKQQVVRIRQP